MPLNVKRICPSVLLVVLSSVLVAQAQTTEPSQTVQPPAPTSGDVMRDRISKAKAFIVVRNYNAAIYELENIRRDTADTSVQAVGSVLLMNSYLEQGEYKRTQDFLNQSYNEKKTSKPNAAANYMSVAGQVVKGARSRAERYRALGLSITDRTPSACSSRIASALWPRTVSATPNTHSGSRSEASTTAVLPFCSRLLSTSSTRGEQSPSSSTSR